MILFAGILFAIWSLTSCNDSNFKELKNINTSSAIIGLKFIEEKFGKIR